MTELLSEKTNPNNLTGKKVLVEGSIISVETEEGGKKIHTVQIELNTGAGKKTISFDLAQHDKEHPKLLIQ